MTLFPGTLNPAAEPASIIYIVTGAIGFAYTRIRKSRKADAIAKAPSTPMLFCRATSHRLLRTLDLL
jgi:hypothetical protein